MVFESIRTLFAVWPQAGRRLRAYTDAIPDPDITFCVPPDAYSPANNLVAYLFE
jgi:hypothetical protein